MSKADWFATLGIFTLLIFIVFFCQYIYEERNPEANPTIYSSENGLRTHNYEIRATSNEINPIEITMTSYSPDRAQTQGNPFETASGLIVTPRDLWELKYIAISRDLKKKYNLDWGDSVYIKVEIVDLMGKTAQGKPIINTIDLFMRNKEIAKNFGKQTREIIIMKEE